MLDALKFVKGSVSKDNKLKPELNHFRIERGRISGLNETFMLSAPIATDVEATPKGSDFAKAVERCKSTVTLYNDAGKLVVKSGRLTVRIDCTTEPFPALQPEGHSFWIAPHFVDMCKKLIPFITKDNTRAWARGALLSSMEGLGAVLTATDNVALVQAYLGPEYVPPLNCVIPEPTLRELVRIGECPKYATVSPRSITFVYEGDRWLCSVLLPNDWPSLTKFFGQCDLYKDVTPDFWEAIESVMPFTDDNDTILFDPGCIRTSVDLKSGASIEGEFPSSKGAVSGKYLTKIRPLVTQIAFDEWPKPMHFRGDYIRGVFAGMVRAGVND